jgi:hypothetical protein
LVEDEDDKDGAVPLRLAKAATEKLRADELKAATLVVDLWTMAKVDTTNTIVLGMQEEVSFISLSFSFSVLFFALCVCVV